MRIVDSTVSLTVDDVAATKKFLVDLFGYEEAIAADGFVSLTHADRAVGIAIHRRGLEVLPEEQRDVATRGMALAFTVADVAAEEARLRAAGANITLPLMEQPWGEKLFQATDPNGIVVEVLEWTEPAPR
ncbi:VOC family protein [Nocardia arthritidis]|nr:VOC family protein [Nocardia arthritidis]